MTVSLQEIEQYWTLDDVLDAHIALDVWETLDWKASEQARNQVPHGKR